MNTNNSKHIRRVLLKLSGETLLGERTCGIDHTACLKVADYLKRIQASGIELGVVIGGGNIFRGIDLHGIQMARTPADQMGMLATIFNGLALQQALIMQNVPTRLMSALDCPQVVERYEWRKACEALAGGSIVIFVGGTGNPYFTTDSAAALRAGEIQASALLKATKVDGVYDKDPLKHKEAIKYSKISYAKVLAEKLGVMDATAVTLCSENRVPIFVFNMQRLLQEPLTEILELEQAGTWISD